VTNALGLVMRTWRNEEKRYLSQILEGVMLSPPSYYEDDIVGECSDKVRVLIEALLDEKEEAESHSSSSSASASATGDGTESKPEPEGFSGLVFVQRRDAVLALAELLSHHPATKDAFRIGTLLGSSDSVNRHAFMDITRTIVPGERVVEEGTSKGGIQGEGNNGGERKEKEEEVKEGDEVAEEMEVEEELLVSTDKGKGVADEDEDMSIDEDAEPTKKDKGKGKLKEMGRLTRKVIKGKPPGPEPSSRPPKAHSAKAQQAILAEFRSGEKNLIISTAVAEEGIDIQACGCVVRWDPVRSYLSLSHEDVGLTRIL
jgi:ERCC4-related helicase